MLRKNLSFLLVLFMILSFGCTSIKLVTKDGIPLPNETIQMTNPETGIKVEAVFVRYYEESPESIYPEYLSSTKINRIPASKLESTKGIILFVRITNPKEVKWKLFKRLRYGEGQKDYVDTMLYEGKDLNKHFQLDVPKVPGKMLQAMAILEYGDGFPMMYLGYFDILYDKEK